MPFDNLTDKKLLNLLREAYVEGWADRDLVPEHKSFEVDVGDYWIKSLTLTDFQNRSSSVTRHSDTETGWSGIGPDGSLLTLKRPKREPFSEFIKKVRGEKSPAGVTRQSKLDKRTREEITSAYKIARSG